MLQTYQKMPPKKSVGNAKAKKGAAAQKKKSGQKNTLALCKKMEDCDLSDSSSSFTSSSSSDSCTSSSCSSYSSSSDCDTSMYTHYTTFSVENLEMHSYHCRSSFLFNWLFIVALTARSYRDCHWFSVLGMVLY